ncbi:MAG: fluoride efflux transporter CrcB [Ktedonobacteraceae bacterium]|nr:fluoride efflux transporter CrcB [Ktedonobacteraceae bacterium]
MTGTSLLLLLGTGLAGALGALARYLLGRFVAERTGTSFPVGTLLINVTGAFVIGVLFALSTRKLLSPTLYVILATGFLGGYTTFSTMSWESVQLIRGGSARGSVVYLGSNVVLGFAGATVGLLIGRVL